MKALFLDRDGIVNEETHYLYRVQDIRWVDGIFPLLAAAREHGYKLIVVTNQSGIARGLYTETDFHNLMDWMRAELAARNTPLDGVYFCPFHPKGSAPYDLDHDDRKPSPGMLLRAAKDHALDLSQSIMIGDRCSDVGAANAAGLRQAFLLRGTEPEPCPGSAITISTLAELTEWIEAN